MPTSMRLSWQLALLALPLVACSSAASADSSAADVVVDPSGPGGDASLTLTVPDLPSTWSAAYTYSIPSQKGALVPKQAVALPYTAGGTNQAEVDVVVTDTATHATSIQLTSHVPLAKGANTLAMGVVGFVDPRAAADVSMTVDASSETAGTVFVDVNGATQTVWTVDPATYAKEPALPLQAGHYTFSSAGGARTVEFDVVAGQSISANLAPPLSVGLVAVTPDPTPARYPSATNPTFLVHCQGDSLGTQSAQQYAQASQKLAVYLGSPASCYWGYGSALASFELKPGDSYTAQVSHLDVDDVSLTDAPGQTVSGSFVVTVASGEVIAGPLPTKSGVDLPPGTYNVVTSYVGTSGLTHTTTNTVTL